VKKVKTKRISFTTTKEERDKALKIVTRFMKFPAHVENIHPHVAQMDICACHANGIPLDFDKFLGFDDDSFLHDFMGIVFNLDRTTGEMRNHFIPRCARKL